MGNEATPDLIIVCGSRDFDDYDLLKRVLDDELKVLPNPQIISGGARGADRLAILYGHRTRTPLHIFFADWETHGKAAGFIRNGEMLNFAINEGSPAVIAFWDGKSKGTDHMIKLARKKNVPVKTICFNSVIDEVEKDD